MIFLNQLNLILEEIDSNINLISIENLLTLKYDMDKIQ
jgi:hypothetical protein